MALPNTNIKNYAQMYSTEISRVHNIGVIALQEI